jgi:succinate-acetate transporter protein
MSDETKIKVAMADAFGAILIGWIAFMMAFVFFDQYGLGFMVGGLSGIVGIALAVVTIMAFLNDNLLGTALFGPLAVFFYVFPTVIADAPEAVATMIIFVGIYLLLLGIISLAQPVKLVPVVLVVAAIALVLVGYWWVDGGETLKTLSGVFLALLGVLATYLGLAIVANTVKGDMVLPLLVKG